VSGERAVDEGNARVTHQLRSLGMAAAFMAVALLGRPGEAAAQAEPFTAYGTGLGPGQVVRAFVDGELCATAVADAQGQWLMQISSSAPCRPSSGDVLSFTLDGQATTATEVWTPGGAPADVAGGIALVPVGPAPPAAGAGTFTPVPTAPGANLGVWGGGSIEAVLAAVPRAVSIWVSAGGELVGYIPGAPDFVNAAFIARFPGGDIPAGTAMLVVLE
jgi:hypothetical protein